MLIRAKFTRFTYDKYEKKRHHLMTLFSTSYLIDNSK